MVALAWQSDISNRTGCGYVAGAAKRLLSDGVFDSTYDTDETPRARVNAHTNP